VWKANDLKYKKPVAIKKIPAGCGSFNKEAQFGSELEHPSICQVLNKFQGQLFNCLVFEYLSGGDVNSELQIRKYFNEHQSKNIIYQVLKALEYLSQYKICHRDIKP